VEAPDATTVSEEFVAEVLEFLESPLREPCADRPDDEDDVPGPALAL
jgi:hypothetical protein